MLEIGKLLYNETKKEVSESITSISIEFGYLVIYTTRGFYKTTIFEKDIYRIKKVKTFESDGLKIKINNKWKFSRLNKNLLFKVGHLTGGKLFSGSKI